MAAFQFPDPAVQDLVQNPITGSTYRWKEDPGKWVIVAQNTSSSDFIWEGPNPPLLAPGDDNDYKLWYNSDTLELYFYYCDVNGSCAWVPTAKPITLLEDLDEAVADLKQDLNATNVAVNENTNRIASIIYFGDEAPEIYPDVDTGSTVPDGTDEGAPIFEQDERNYKLWLNTSTDKLSVLRIDEAADEGYSYQEIDTDNNVTLQEVLDNGNTADKSIVLTNGSDDALLLSPEEGRIMVGGKDNVVPKLELRHSTGVLDTSLVALELDQDGKRFDIECDERVNNIHFRFNNDDKLVLNKEGDAVFDGSVDIKDGLKTSGNVNMKFSPKDGKNQLLTLDSGSSYLPMLHLKSYTGDPATTDGEEPPEVDTVARKDVFIVRASGEAELSGHLSVMPGTKDNQAVTYNQLLEVEQEIEALVPSVERGQFEITLEPVDGDTASDGKFNLLRDYTQDDKDAATAICFQAYSDCIFNDPEGTRPCQAELEACSNAIPAVGSKVTTDDFGLTRQIKFSIKDINGDNHNWSTVAVGQLIEVFNQEDDSYLIAEVTATEGMWYELITFTVTPIKYKGSATGVCRIKIFELDLSSDVDLDFVRLSGKNKVENDWKIESETKTHLHVQDGKTKIYWLQDPTSAQHPVTQAYADRNYFQINEKNQTTDPIWIRPKNADGQIKGNAGVGNMLVVNQESDGQGSIVRIQQGGTDALKVESDQTVNLFHNRVKQLADPIAGDDGAQDAINRRYLESYVAANVRRLWKWTGDQSSTPGEGKFSWAQSGAGYCYFDHRPFIGSELICTGNKYLCKGGDSQSPDKEMGFAFMTLWEWTSDGKWEPCKSGHLSASGIRTGKNNEPWRFSVDKNSILNLKDLTTDGVYAICVAGTVLT